MRMRSDRLPSFLQETFCLTARRKNLSPFVLDPPRGFDWMARMIKKFFAVGVGAALIALVTTGCVSTVAGGKAGGVPFIKDRIEAKYDRPAEEVFQAAKEVIAKNGVLVKEGILHGQTNAVNGIVRAIEGNVNETRVWVSVAQVDPRISAVAVQTRTKNGGTDIDLAASIDKQIALKLVR